MLLKSEEEAEVGIEADNNKIDLSRGFFMCNRQWSNLRYTSVFVCSRKTWEVDKTVCSLVLSFTLFSQIQSWDYACLWGSGIHILRVAQEIRGALHVLSWRAWWCKRKVQEIFYSRCLLVFRCHIRFEFWGDYAYLTLGIYTHLGGMCAHELRVRPWEQNFLLGESRWLKGLGEVNTGRIKQGWVFSGLISLLWIMLASESYS